MEEVTDPDPGFYSHLFLVKKKNGKYRSIIDLSRLNRFIKLEKFKNGDDSINPRVHSARRLGCLHKYQRRLPSHKDTSQIPEVLTLPVSRENTPVQSPSVWTNHSSLRFYGNDGSCGSPHSKIGISSDPVFRRLVTASLAPNDPPSQPNISMADNSISRSNPKYREVGTNTDSDLYLCRDVLSNPVGNSLSPSRSYRCADDSSQVCDPKRTTSRRGNISPS